MIPNLLRLYPRWWRERYGAEVAEVLQLHPASWSTYLDLARGALDARIHATGDPRRFPMDDIRRRTHVILSAFLVFCAAGCALEKLGEDGPPHTSVSHGMTAWEWRGIIATALVAGAAALWAGVPSSLTALRQDGRGQSGPALPAPGRVASFAVLPIAMAFCALGAIAWGLGLRADSPAAFRGPNGLHSSSFAISWAAIVAAMVLSTAIATRAAVGHRRPRQPVAG